MLANFIAVGLGGMLGSMGRYGCYLLLSRFFTDWLPWGTLAVNVLGCLAIGVLSGFPEERWILPPHTRLFLTIGLLGGFTTFSAFGLETWALAQRHSVTLGAMNVALNLALGLGAVWLGHALARGASQ